MKKLAHLIGGQRRGCRATSHSRVAVEFRSLWELV